MENASKALIIAGAILLSILIISLGIMIYRQATEAINTDAMDEVSLLQFNERFTQHEGPNVRGSNVNALLDTVKNNNLANSNDTSKQVKVTVTATDTDWSGTKPNKAISNFGAALTGKTYKVECGVDANSGFVNTITISNSGS